MSHGFQTFEQCVFGVLTGTFWYEDDILIYRLNKGVCLPLRAHQRSVFGSRKRQRTSFPVPGYMEHWSFSWLWSQNWIRSDIICPPDPLNFRLKHKQNHQVSWVLSMFNRKSWEFLTFIAICGNFYIKSFPSVSIQTE